MDPSQFDSLPNRRFFEHGRLRSEDAIDPHGFLSPKGVAITTGIRELLDLPLALIVAPPWYGKTFVAEALYNFLSSGPELERDEFPFGTYVHDTFFHRYGSASSIEPPWWTDWQKQGTQRACWIVDAVDEDWHTGSRATFGILDYVERLTPEMRAQLSVILFCRKNEVPDEFREKLEAVYSPGVPIVTLELAPPDENEALRIAGSPRNLEVAKRLIDRNELRSVGGYPAVIKQLARRSPDNKVTRKELWRCILQERLRGGHRERHRSSRPPDSFDQFDAAKRAAAVCLFAGLRELDSGSGESPSLVGINTLFSHGAPRYDRLQDAAHSLRYTDLLTPTATGLRFSERHVQEWLAAFALEDVPLSQLRSVLSRDDEPLGHLRGVIAILGRISKHKEVRDWIVEIHGGLPSPSDTLPWELQDAVGWLDRLEAFARRSPYGLQFWQSSGLEHLAVPGIGRVLADRLGDSQRSSREKMLLLEAAEAVRATEILPHVQQILLDTNQEDRLRYDCSYTLVRLGGRDHFARLVPFVHEANPVTREQRVVVANVIRGLLSHGVWAFREAYPYTPPGDQGIADASSVVEHELRERMTIEDARWLLTDFDWDQQSHRDLRRTPGLRVYHQHHGKLSFALHAVKLLLHQDRIDQNDWSQLHAVVFARDDGAIFHALVENIIEKARADVQARRMLFEAGLHQDPTGKRNWGWRWRWALTIDDADWLAKLAQTEGLTRPWLWDHLLALAHSPDVDNATKEHIRAQVERASPEILMAFDRGREEAEKEQRRWQAEHERIRKEQEQPQFQLKDVVERVLNADELTIQQTLHNLSWVCFLEDGFRPNNIIGRFDELAREMQQQILAKCSEALRDADPTPIPNGNSYPAGIMYEAEAFANVIRRFPDHQLENNQICKWLPSALVFSVPNNSDLLARCIEADRAATEDVLTQTFGREIRSNDSGRHNASNLPTDDWSDRLIQKALEIVQDETLPVPGRNNLLRVVAARAPKAADAVARRWLDVPGGSPDDNRAKRLAAVDSLLHSDPTFGVAELSKAVTDLGAGVVEQISTLGWRPGAGTAALRSWPPEALENLTLLLHRVFPVDLDPPEELGQVRWVGPGDELRRLRDMLPQMLFDRSGPEETVALERLSAKLPSVRTWYEGARANKDAAEFINTTPAPEGAVPWNEVVRLLDDARYRLIRGPADLQRVLIDELRQIEKTVKKHLALLYQSGNRGERQGENALQAYFHARLTDRLKDRVLGPSTSVVLNRETQEAFNRKFDIKVESLTVERTNVTVVIELKWSDYRDKPDKPGVSRSLREQLGTRYLLANDLTHGIYLVGWFKPVRWADTTVDEPDDPTSPQSWEDALQRQAAAFASDHPSIDIRAIVVDLQWDVP